MVATTVEREAYSVDETAHTLGCGRVSVYKLINDCRAGNLQGSSSVARARAARGHPRGRRGRRAADRADWDEHPGVPRRAIM
jgi:hypothetical protein